MEKPAREMSLEEFVGTLPPTHRARKELDELLLKVKVQGEMVQNYMRGIMKHGEKERQHQKEAENFRTYRKEYMKTEERIKRDNFFLRMERDSARRWSQARRRLLRKLRLTLVIADTCIERARTWRDAGAKAWEGTSMSPPHLDEIKGLECALEAYDQEVRRR